MEYGYDSRITNCGDPNCTSCNPDGVVNKEYLDSPTGKYFTSLREDFIKRGLRKESRGIVLLKKLKKLALCIKV